MSFLFPERNETPPKEGFMETEKARPALMVVYRGKCQYCKQFTPRDALAADHIEPRANGGPNHLYNYILSCNSCNSKKNSASLPRRERNRLTSIAILNYPEIIKFLGIKECNEENSFVNIDEDYYDYDNCCPYPPLNLEEAHKEAISTERLRNAIMEAQNKSKLKDKTR